jgi:hypothetical protein
METHLRSAAALFVIMVATAGCAGGGHGGPLPGAGSVSQSASKQTVTLTIDIPTGSAGASAVRRPRYISPATTQMAIDVQTGCPGSCTPVAGYPATVALTTTTGGCSSTLASTQCQLTVQLAPGNYTITLTTEDAGNKALSIAQNVAFNVVAGRNNALSVTLSGIPVQIVATVLSATSNTVLIQALDANNDPIAGPGSPTFSITRASGIGVALVEPTTASPNEFSAIPAATGTAMLDVTASYPASGATNACTLSVAVCNATFTLTSSTPVTDLFVANAANNTVEEFAAPYTGSPVASITSGLEAPGAIAFNSVGDMFVGNSNEANYNALPSGEGNIMEYAPPYTGAPLATIPTNANNFLAFDAGDDLFESGGGEVFESKPPYVGNSTRLISGGTIVQTPAGVVLDAAGDLFVADVTAGYVYEFAPPYTGNAKATTPSSALGLPEGVTLDSSGNLFVADTFNNAVDEFASPYTGAPKVTIDGNSSGLDGPTDLAFDPGGDLYVTNYGNIYAAQKTINDTITAYAPPFTSSSGPIATLANSLDGPAGLAFHTTYSIAVK